MKRILIVFMFAMFIMAPKAEAFSWKEFFSWLFTPVETTTVDTTKLYEDTNTKINNIKTQVSALEPSLKTAILSVASALSTQTEMEELKTKLNTSNADTFKIISDYQKSINAEKARILVTIKTMPDKEKTAFAKEVTTLANLGQKYSDLSTEIWNLKSSFSSSAPSGTDRTAKLKEINEFYSDVSNKSSVVSGFSNLIKIYARLTGLTI